MGIKTHKWLLIIIVVFSVQTLSAQFPRDGIKWTSDGNGYYKLTGKSILKIDLATGAETHLVDPELLAGLPTSVAAFSISADNNKILIFTNTARVWRYKTRGDYWVLDIPSKKLSKLGATLTPQSLMYAKLSPDGRSVAYVSEKNIYVEDILSNKIKQLTFDGTRKLINGTFDWVYEEEFQCRDGFRWSPDGQSIAFWQIDATKIRDYYMLNTTDSIYSRVIPVEYPKVGESPSPARIGVINVNSGNIKWMNVEGDPQQHYITRMEWNDAKTLVIQQLNRKQQVSKLFYCNTVNGSSYSFYTESNNSWIETKDYWNNDDPTGWEWLNNGKEFLWVSEKDGWRHIYKLSSDGKKETLLTIGKYDIQNIKCIDTKGGYVYFMASPDNATQLYLYRVKLDGKSKQPEAISNLSLKGTNDYTLSPNARWAKHSFSSYKVPPVEEWVNLQNKMPLTSADFTEIPNTTVEYTKITTEDGVTLDAWINKPINFDSTKKYPIVFYVYGEPGSSTVTDEYGNQNNFLYDGDMSAEGYFQVSVDNRGTPSLKGAAWRKAIYRNIGRINVRDIAMAAKKIIDKPYIDKDRVAVWGWSGGGSTTLHLLFQYPELFKTGISIAALDNLLFYDNIYEERYMGLPQENREDFVKGSAINYVKNLKGNLLVIHGTGDDNVHYSNAEALVNELIKYNKLFQFMPYPNRTHSLSEGEGTRAHLSNIYTDYLRKNCPPGAK
ncbi:S9 family peptidase [Ferruginibacter lapsinanis]|uniref:S9 family peptidase n=1 Tax=Ferruginibacter lapsinanis TaxID=563172 RepID=UPI001E46E4C3|nr:DPP IV N-terminal domain-containing protein [Ferruginibacter lapsinanis]UEG50169.1 S9 family peptidase [Ferruginibacter lapsinanis]